MNARALGDGFARTRATPSRAFSFRRVHWLALVLASLVAGVVAWAALTPIAPDLREDLHVIPQGTWARRSAGEDIQVLPSTVHLTMGVKDILVLVNKDDVPQLFGPVLMMPGQSFHLPFNLASEYQFTCTAHLSGFLTVIVDPPPPWWKLSLLRLQSNIENRTWRLAV